MNNTSINDTSINGTSMNDIMFKFKKKLTLSILLFTLMLSMAFSLNQVNTYASSVPSFNSDKDTNFNISVPNKGIINEIEYDTFFYHFNDIPILFPLDKYSVKNLLMNVRISYYLRVLEMVSKNSNFEYELTVDINSSEGMESLYPLTNDFTIDEFKQIVINSKYDEKQREVLKEYSIIIIP